MTRFFAAALLAGVLAGTAMAQEARLGPLRIDGAFARATPDLAKNGAAYLRIENHGDTADRLLSARSEVAGRAELHSHRNDDGMMRMRAIEDGIPVPAGGQAELAPGGDHVMLMGLRAPLREGESFPLTLTFEHAGEVTLDIPVMGIAARGGHKHH